MITNEDRKMATRLGLLKSKPGGKNAIAMFQVLSDLVKSSPDADSILIPFEVTSVDRADVKLAMLVLSEFLTNEMRVRSTRIIELDDIVTLEVNAV